MKGDDRRAAIVQAAVRLFAENGFRGTTTRELAAASGVTEPVLYQHFRTKRDLYSAIIEAKTAESVAQEPEFQALSRAGDDRGLFTALGEAILARYEIDPEMARLLLYSSLERHELSDLFFEHVVADFYKFLTGHIRRRSREGAFRKVDAVVAAHGFVGMISHHGLVAILHPDRPRRPRRKVVAETVAIFLDGIKTSEPALRTGCR